MTDEVERTTIRTAFLRLMPLLLLCYFLAYIDRINIGFAALTMNRDLGLSAYVYGVGAGLFFWGYFFFEVPSNLILEKVGARRWISRIMITWGLVSAAMVFVTGPKSFLAMRFLLGAAEAGFFPGIILYLTYWFPAAYRGRIIAVFSVAIPASLGIGAPLSTAIMELHGIAGLHGWQWLFLLEGLPTVIVGLIVLALLPDRPRDARWLSAEQKAWLQGTLDRESRAAQAAHGLTLWKIFLDPRVLGLALIYFANTTANLGLAFFLPQIIKGMGLSNVQTGLLTSIPYIMGTIGILVWGYVSDRTNERRISLCLALVVSAAGLAGAAYLGSSTAAIAAMAVAAIGIYGTKAPFWPLPSTFLTGSAAAGGIALINSIGNLGGFAGPSIVGWVKDATGSFEAGLYALAAIALLAAGAALLIVRPPPRSREPVGETLGRTV
ncbi:MFS transporter [Bradyrhizobium sp. U87765 SZCCT0131]|uniref:MFS transporter n=1 Tax=unclassified Bradyrhizobium TaxID=2631580 RepID=UPI001BA53BA3|nr:MULTISPECIES: MFS transporter [unclassified Bradyrhizobium]MBR1219410.1 MFS transporter [Bradyrhizobium sp. U87765 SZCCT0131]MBR1262061.1 MFS transporter [Bradyrhizobium sp. U87765 SZCCT0134]MBR1306086.1 MFS transporter [Bradyrhizobium sp. U87765 SZCCT0110]MBR1317843.1 MFS transporter [Bradyrhizobium sp. U87765 SZCCT0109]MBR1351545.1 MFS transporter [Bradyrhizobium sp. U87765 SZCCT0048]